VSIVVTIYDVVADVIFKSPTVWVYDVVTTAIAVAFLIGGSYSLMPPRAYPHHCSARSLVAAHQAALRHRHLDSCDRLSRGIHLVLLQHGVAGGPGLGGRRVRMGQPTPVIVKVSMVIGALLMIVQMISKSAAT